MSQPQPRGFQSRRLPEMKEPSQQPVVGGFVSRRVPEQQQQTPTTGTGQGSFVSLRTVAYQGLGGLPVQYSVFFGRYRRKHPSVPAKKIAKKYELAILLLHRGS